MDYILVASPQCVLESDAHGAPDAEIEREIDHRGACGACDLGRPVRRPVVDHHDVDARQFRKHLVDDSSDGLFLVKRGHHDERVLEG